MEEDKVLTLKSLEKQVKNEIAELKSALSKIERKIEIIEKSLRR